MFCLCLCVRSRVLMGMFLCKRSRHLQVQLLAGAVDGLHDDLSFSFSTRSLTETQPFSVGSFPVGTVRASVLDTTAPYVLLSEAGYPGVRTLDSHNDSCDVATMRWPCMLYVTKSTNACSQSFLELCHLWAPSGGDVHARLTTMFHWRHDRVLRSTYES